MLKVNMFMRKTLAMLAGKGHRETYMWLTVLYVSCGAGVLPFVANKFHYHWFSLTGLTVLATMTLFALGPRYFTGNHRLLGGRLAKADWPSYSAVSTWIVFAVLGYIGSVVLNKDLYKNSGPNPGLWLWWGMYGTVAAIILGIDAIKGTLRKRYFEKIVPSAQYSTGVKQQYLKMLQDKWSNQLTWFTAVFLVIGVTGTLTAIGLAASPDTADRLNLATV
jgi:multisubunit Na+/H+ antiporter MnhF subunit